MSAARPRLTVSALHPQITSVSPSPFSPKQGKKTTFRIHLSGTEHVSFAVRNGNGQIIQGPHTPGALGAGLHTYQWDGKNNAGQIAGNGLYTIVVTTSAESRRRDAPRNCERKGAR